MKTKLKQLISSSISAWMMNSAPSSSFDANHTELIYIYVKEKVSGLRLGR